LWQNISITPCEAFEYMMLDAPLTAGFTLCSNWLCWILDILKKEYYPYYISSIEHPESSILTSMAQIYADNKS
jgi:hypothetical protein